jgi:hypothetical protein
MGRWDPYIKCYSENLEGTGQLGALDGDERIVIKWDM